MFFRMIPLFICKKMWYDRSETIIPQGTGDCHGKSKGFFPLRRQDLHPRSRVDAGWHLRAGVLQIAHGIAKYTPRYEPFASFLFGKGIQRT